jgi:hypothetical protein
MFTPMTRWSALAERPSARLRMAGELLSALVVGAVVALALWASGCSAVVAEPSRCENTSAACAARCAPCPASWSGNYCTFAGCDCKRCDLAQPDAGESCVACCARAASGAECVRCCQAEVRP